MYSFWSIGRCCEATCAKSHGEVGRVICGNNYFGGVMEAIALGGVGACHLVSRHFEVLSAFN